MRIGIYGGTFNPIHKGHVALARTLCKAALVDQVWFMVSPLNPLKQDQAADLLPDPVRLHLARLATARYPQLRVSDFETRLPIPSYTVNLLDQLRGAWPQEDFVLVIGEDNWQRFSSWYKADELRATCDILVYPRGSSTSHITLHRKDGTDEAVAPCPQYDISSTRLRESLRAGDVRLARKWLQADVCRYLVANRCWTT